MPRTVYWIEMPVNFKDKDQAELLLMDIWIEPKRLGELSTITDKHLIVFINLDYALFSKSALQAGTEFDNIRKLFETLKQLSVLHVVGHTTHLNDQVKSIFKKQGASYLELNLFDQKTAISSINKVVNLLYEKMGRARRSHLRIQIPEKANIQGVITLQNNQIIDGYIKDISMNGLCLHIADIEKLEAIPLKGFVKLQFNLAAVPVKISTAIVVRIDKGLSEIGLYFESSNPKMMKPEVADQFKALLYQWIRDMIEESNISNYSDSPEN